MRIGIDARELCGRSTGVGRYLAGLLHEWSSDPDRYPHEFILYVPEATAFERDPSRFTICVVPGSGGSWWEQRNLADAVERDRVDVFFAPGYSAPIRLRMPVVVTIHDISFVAHPEWFRTREGMRRRWLARRTARAAACVITVSEFSRRELVEYFGLAESSVRVIPQGIFQPSPADAYNERRVPHDERSTQHAVRHEHLNVLYVGSIFNRRHVPDLIRAFAPIARRHTAASLTLVGENRTYPRENLLSIAEREGVAASLVWRPYVSDAELNQLYATSRAFAFLSEYEGLGMTPLEALAAGVPAVLMDTPVARETCENAVLYVDPADRNATTTALERLLFDEAIRGGLLREAPRVLAKYDWRRAASDTLAVLEASARASA